jgi:hypothetical protein
MNIIYGIILFFFVIFFSTPLWDLRLRNRTLNALIADSVSVKDTIIKTIQLTPLTEKERITKLFINTYDSFEKKISEIESFDKSANRKVFFTYMICLLVIFTGLYNLGYIYLIIGFCISFINFFQDKPSQEATNNLLRQYRLILETFIEWKASDKESLKIWLERNKKYSSLVQAIS